MAFTDAEADLLRSSGLDPEELLDPARRAAARAYLYERQAVGHPVVSWMLAQREELGGQTPVAWLASGKDRSVVDRLRESYDRR